jgi:hypothetical protein
MINSPEEAKKRRLEAKELREAAREGARKRKQLIEAAMARGLSKSTVYQRIYRLGMTFEEAARTDKIRRGITSPGTESNANKFRELYYGTEVQKLRDMYNRIRRCAKTLGVSYPTAREYYYLFMRKDTAWQVRSVNRVCMVPMWTHRSSGAKVSVVAWVKTMSVGRVPEFISVVYESEDELLSMPVYEFMSDYDCDIGVSTIVLDEEYETEQHDLSDK